ncbi:hypothetical protein BKA66DRAFT_474397 [Pyrenochaeta sp. MPI-SDFR-AT-0127]|nr:hypothetical protein BKA66DRAFT_474397 [Pyrenochaeta sp. MPI-SDFR-AT-0127]
MCLVHSCPAVERRAHARFRNSSQVDYHLLHLTATALFAQVQAQCPPSLYLIQAGLLLAVYEYVSGRPDKAFASISGCTRMAYAARIHVCNQPSKQPPWRPIDEASSALAYKLQTQEAANTWWGIIISERTFFCDITVTEQPLLASISSGDARLPLDPSLLERDDLLGVETSPHVPVSYLTAVDVDGFGRAAQAAWLLDQVTKASDISNVNSQLFQLQGLDATLQSFLVALMQQCSAGQEKFCEAIAITIRALFALHWRILVLQAGLAVERSQPQQDCCKSHAALNTAINIVLDIVVAHKTCTALCIAPSLPYLIRAALKHVYGKTKWEEDDWLRSVEERLRTALDQFAHHHEGNGL